MLARDSKRKKLRALMELYDVNSSKVAALLGVQHATVHIYLSKSGAEIPKRSLKLLELELEKEYGSR